MIIFKDDMKNETIKIYFALPIYCFIYYVMIFNGNYPTIGIVVLGSLALIPIILMMFSFLVTIRYKVVVTKEKIIVRTLIQKIEVNLKDVSTYTYKKNRITVYYLFRIVVKDICLLVNTKYKDEFEKILNEYESMDIDEITTILSNLETEEKMRKRKLLGDIFYWLTFASPIAAGVSACLIGEIDIFGFLGMVRYSWIMWFFVSFGILSIIIGKKLKQNKQVYIQNIVVPYICIPILLILGSLRFIVTTVSYDDSIVNTIENKINLDLPNQVKVATLTHDSYSVSYLKISDNDEKDKFENEIMNSALWKNQLNTEIYDLLPTDIQREIEYFDYFVFYNITINEYNVYPGVGEYECVFISYECEKQMIIILDAETLNL